MGRARAEALKLRRRDRRVASSDVLEVEVLAMRTGILGDEAQALVDRLGGADVEQAARSLKGKRKSRSGRAR
ncbi:hypothetical protein NKH19_12020 [Mesorhizobium sp. M1338]